jgi:hypothetical protein
MIAGTKISLIKVDFPDPETPVMHTTPDKGILTFKFFILF